MDQYSPTAAEEGPRQSSVYSKNFCFLRCETYWDRVPAHGELKEKTYQASFGHLTPVGCGAADRLWLTAMDNLALVTQPFATVLSVLHETLWCSITVATRFSGFTTADWLLGISCTLTGTALQLELLD